MGKGAKKLSGHLARTNASVPLGGPKKTGSRSSFAHSKRCPGKRAPVKNPDFCPGGEPKPPKSLLAFGACAKTLQALRGLPAAGACLGPQALDAFIFAAGLGTRMGPLSSALPKPAWTLRGKPLLQWAADSLRRAGCANIACNAHHKIAAIKSAAGGIEVTEEPVLLGTGEPLRRLAGRISDRGLMVWNGDIIADAPFGRLREVCMDREAGVGWLLVPHPGGPWTELYLDLGGRVLPRGTAGPRGPYLFTGAAWWSAAAAAALPDNCFDVRDFLAQYPRHLGVVAEPFPWLEVGTPDQLIQAAKELAPDNEGRIPGCYIHPEANAPDVSAKLKRCILGPGAALGPGMEDSDALWFLDDGGAQARMGL